jgi:hypothetical protein
MARWQDSIHFVVMGVSPIVDDQIWQVWKNQTIWFPILDCLVSTVSEQSQGAKFEDLKIQGVL